MSVTTSQNDALHPERRAKHRNKVFRGAIMSFNNGNSVMNCVVRNLTSTGAMLTLGETTGVPERFLLCIGDEKPIPAQVCWRRLTSVGVTFV